MIDCQNKKACVVILGGNKPTFEMFESSLRANVAQKPYIICADSGYDAIKDFGISPDILVGDMDSIMQIPKNIETIHFDKDKDMSDGEIAVDYVLEKGFNHITLLGADGGREDHLLANLALMVRCYRKNAFVKMITHSGEIFICGSNEKFRKKLVVGSTMSIVPFGSDLHINSTKGLKWQIKNKVISVWQSSLGVSNVVVESDVEIDVESGFALIFLVA